MIINQNIEAKKVNNVLGKKQTEMGKVMAKLSSGQRINRAGDDAAGLAISEKMRGQIRGLDQTIRNSADGQSFLNTADSSLASVHDELQRMREMAVNAASDTNTKSDREVFQREFAALSDDIDRIAKTTEFNTIPVFKYDEPKGSNNSAAGRTITTLTANTMNNRSVEQIIADTKPGEFNIFYGETTYDFTTTQTPGGGNTSTAWDAQGVRNILQTEIVPNVVEQILDAYPAFGYLKGSSIGIGLRLYSDASSSVLASVATSKSGNTMTYTLNVNMATVNLTNANSRIELEKTIAHEMIHAFMFESSTAGMMGSDRFPLWFIEGMAQTASGPGNWVGALGLNATSSDSAIKTALANNSLAGNSNAGNYGTGYLAAMYLGYKANGGGAVTAQGISNGLSKIMADVINGESLSTSLQTHTGYANVDAFAAGFASAADVTNFVRGLLTATGSGAGGVVSGNLTAKDVVADATKNVNLFYLNTSKDAVKNDYTGTGVTVNSGGGKNNAGTKPVDGYNPSEIGPVGGTTTTKGDFAITTNVTSGYSFDGTTLTITAPGNYSVAMAGGVTSTVQKIKVADGVNLTLNGIVINSTTGPALEIVENASAPPSAKAQITLAGTNTLNATGNDGIHIAGKAEVTISGKGMLAAKGDNGIGGGAKVTIQGGTVVVTGTTNDIKSDAIVIEGGSVVVDKNKLDGKTPTLDGTVWAYNHKFNANSSTNAFIKNAAQITLANGKTFPVAPDSTNGLSLWLEGKDQTVKVTDTNGVAKTYYLKFDTIANSFSIEHAYPNDLFKVGGTSPSQNVNDGCSFDPDTGILTIRKPGNYNISGGTGTNIAGDNVVGQIVVDMNPPDAGDVNITFDNVKINQAANTGKAAMEIKSGANVNLTLKGTNELKSNGARAGLQVNSTANLKILGDGILSAVGGNTGGAGIGGAEGTAGGAIVIEGGKIFAKGGGDGAGVGSGSGGTFGDITIRGTGEVNALGGSQGAGIGSGGNGSCGDILIEGNCKVNSDAGALDAGIGTGVSARCGNITIRGDSVVTAKGGEDGAGIGTGLNGVCKKIIIDENCKIISNGFDNAAGIGGGWRGICDSIEIGGKADVQTQGGKFGAGIGAGKEGQCKGTIKISGESHVVAKGGELGAGIGAGERGKHANIEITGGVVYAEGGVNGTGIGGGRWATAQAGSSIVISGGVVTALGGLTADGGNIGAYTDSEHNAGSEIPIKIGATTVQAGTAGEGKYNTNGAYNDAGKQIYAYPLDLLNIPPATSIAPGTSIAPETVTSIASKGVVTGETGAWSGVLPTVIGHLKPDGTTAQGNSYIWMQGENQTVTVTLSNGNTIDLDLIFYPESGIFRLAGQPIPPPAVPPNNPSNPDPDIHPPVPPVPPNPPDPPTPPSIEVQEDGLKLQIGAHANQMMIIPQFWLSQRVLNLTSVNLLTRENADAAIEIVDSAIERVSGMRTTYGALSNRLDNVIDVNGTISENLSKSESRIRDADMAKEMMKYQMMNVQSQAAQAMLAQANQKPQQALSLLQ